MKVDGTRIYYSDITIYPILERVFQPHKIISDVRLQRYLGSYIIKDTSQPIQRNLDGSINDVLRDKWSKITKNYDFKEPEDKVKFLIKNLQRIQSELEFKILHKVLDMEYNNFSGINILAPIVNEIDLASDISIIQTKHRVNHLFSLDKNAKKLFQKTVHKAIKNIILENKGKFTLSINSYYELVQIIRLFRGFGVVVHPSKIIEAIENDKELSQYLFSDEEEKIWDNYKYARIIDILGPYITNPELTRYNFKKGRKKSIASKINFELSRRSRRREPNKLKEMIKEQELHHTVKEHGRHKRNSKLAMLVKELFEYTCEACKRKEDKGVIIEVSHKIPLYFGYNMGGVDKHWNMEVLCHDCHMQYEARFDKKVFHDSGLKTRQELKDYLRRNYPENFMDDPSVKSDFDH